MDEAVLQKATLATETLKQASVDLNVFTLSQVKDAIQTIVTLARQLNSDTERQQFAQHLSSIGTAVVFTSLIKTLQKEYTAQNWPCITTLRSACITLSSMFELFCSDLLLAGYITMLLNQLKKSGEAQIVHSAEEYLTVTALCTLENCALCVPERGILDVYWNYKAQDIFLPYSQSSLSQVSIPALIILGLMNSNADKDVVCVSSDAITPLLAKIVAAASDKSSQPIMLNYIAVSLLELLKGARGLALNGTIAKMFFENEAPSSLIKLLKTEADDDKMGTVELLWTITTHDSAKELLCNIPELLDELRLRSDKFPAARCALIRIEGWKHLEDISSTINYLQGAYEGGRYSECVSVCESVLKEVEMDKSSCKRENISTVQLYMGKSLYCKFRNTKKYSTDHKADIPLHKKKDSLGEVKTIIITLGILVDENTIDDEGRKYLDLAMVEYIRVTNNLTACKRCLLCHSNSQLKSSHVIPNFVLSGFAKGMKSTSSKKVYCTLDGSSDYKEYTPRQAAWWMLCSKCENLLSRDESHFAKEFFYLIYEKSDVDNPSKEVQVKYSQWLYQFSAGLIFRALAVNAKGMVGFLNDDVLYKVFANLRKILLTPEDAVVNHPEIAIFVNPLSLPETSLSVSSAIHRLLNMPGFISLVEDDEKVNHCRIPRIANHMLIHLGIINIVSVFPGGKSILPKERIIDPQSGVFVVPVESERFEKLPTFVWNSLTLAAETLEVTDIQVTQERLEATSLNDSQPGAIQKVFGMEEAVRNDKEFIKRNGFQPSSDPAFPKVFNFLPSGIAVNRNKANQLVLPVGHKLLLHQTLNSKEFDQEGVTFFLCIGDDEGGYGRERPYIVQHRFMPGLHMNYGYFISPFDLSPDELLPDKHPKVYASHLVADLKSSGIFQKLFSGFLTKVGTSVHDLIVPQLRDVRLISKCIPLCWFCYNKCDVCFTQSFYKLERYRKKFTYCSEACKTKLVKPPPVSNSLPEGFEIRNEFKGSCYVKLPENHLTISHGTTEFIAEGDHDRSGDLTVFLCKSAGDYDFRPYVICHLHSLVEQFSVGIFISVPDLVLLELLPGTSPDSSHTVFVDSFYSSGIVSALLLQKLTRQEMKNIVELNEWESLDKHCQIPCWYCQKRCINCFAVTDQGKFCSTLCQEKQKSSPFVLNGLPDGLIVNRSLQQGSGTDIVILPEGHRHLLHTSGSIHTREGEVASELTIVLCLDSNEKVYTLLHDYMPKKNVMANVAFYISTEDFSVGRLLCSSDVAVEIYMGQIKSQIYNIPDGIKYALERRGYRDMASLVQQARAKTVDIKCFPHCWFCKSRCCVCLQPASITTSINGESILHCSEDCLKVIYQNPGIIHILPPGYKVCNNPDGVDCGVTLPQGHSVLFHVCREYKRKSGRFGQYILFVCVNTEDLSNMPYALYHQFNSLRQLTFGFYISHTTFEPKEPLQYQNKEDQMKCLNYLQQILTLEPVGEIIRSTLAKFGVSTLQIDSQTMIKDDVCVLPCWYCTADSNTEQSQS